MAKKAGVSISAVSRALNNYEDINEETKAKILKVVDELHYIPSASARRLVTNKSNVIAVFYPSYDGMGLRQPFIIHLLDVFKIEIGKKGYDLLILSNMKEPFNRYSYLERVRHQDIDGVLLLGAPEEAIDELIAENVPVVGVDHFAVGKKVGSVTSDNRRAIHDLIVLLYHNGYRRVGFVHDDLNFPVVMERLQGFYSGMAEVGLSPESKWIFGGGFSFDGGMNVAESILELDEKPEVMVFSGDISAIGALQVFSKYGVKVPDEISIIGFDDIDAASYVYPKLTTVSQDKDKMGQLAADTLVHLIENKDINMPLHFVLPTQLIIRDSTRPLKQR